MFVHGTSTLPIAQGTTNQVKYVDMLENRRLRQVSEWFPDKNFIFQQNGAPCHTGKMSMKWFHT